jgi:hypothetical protein
VSKAEARIARQIAKDLKQQEKSARLRVEPEALGVRAERLADSTKQVRLGADPGSVFQMQMRWTVSEADQTGAWSWGVTRKWTDDDWDSALHPKLLEFEKLTWAEIESHAYGNEGKRHRAHHGMESDQVCGEAQDRLHELERDYPETLFRFRLGNLPRLWGVRVVNEFQVLWYDPTHKIYPVD